MNDLLAISSNLHTQDNRITANPIFLVQQKHRVYGLEESDQYIWIDPSGEEVDDPDEIAQLDFKDEGGDLDGDYRKSYYRDEYVFVQPFFTEHGAQAYIKVNGHNLREPRIYVEGGYRNAEWELVRTHLMGLRGEGWKS